MTCMLAVTTNLLFVVDRDRTDCFITIATRDR